MTDTYTIEQIREAISRADATQSDCSMILKDWVDIVISELTRPQYEFRVGQVFCSCEEMYAAYNNHGVHDGMRPLNQSEVGPDWVSREAVEDLRAAVELLCSLGDYDEETEIGKALAAFDEKVKP